MKAEFAGSLSTQRPAPATSRGASVAEIAGYDKTLRKRSVDSSHAAKRANEAAQSQREGREAAAETLRELADKLNVSSTSIGRKLRFQFDELANTSVIQVYERETDRLIRQIPSEEVLERMRRNDQQFTRLIETLA